MNGGKILVNLFEIKLPDTINVYALSNCSLEAMRARLYPAQLYQDDESGEIFTYGRANHEELLNGEDIVLRTFTTQENPQFIARVAIDAITEFLLAQGYDLAQRSYTTYKRELINVKTPLKIFRGSVAIYQSYAIQTMYLNFDGQLRYFLLVAPKLRHEFTIPLDRISAKVDCTGRYLKANCPADCIFYDCELHKWRDRLIGRMSGFSDTGFQCHYYKAQPEMKNFVELTDARLDIKVPTRVCHLEASLANIRFVFEKVLSKDEVNQMVSSIRVLSGDLQSPGRVNLEAGRKRYQDCLSFVKLLADPFEIFGTQFQIMPEPIQAIEGIPLQDQAHGFLTDQDQEEGSDSDDIPF